MAKTSLYPAEALRNWGAAVFEKIGVAHDEAQTAAEVLVESNLRGVDSHGIHLLEMYARRMIKGLVNPTPKMTFRQTRSGTGLLDADTALGQLAALKAMDHAVDLARKTGVGTVAVRRSTHCGAAGYYTLHAAKQDMIGIVHCHADTGVVVFGGTKPFLGTNPYSVAIPAGRHQPFVMDMATSQVNYFRLKVIEAGATEIPAHWAVDSDGNPVTDPTKVAAISPMAGAKGWALGLMIEIFSAILGGSKYGPGLIDQVNDFENPESLSHFVQAIDPSAFVSIEEFKARIDELFDDIKSQPATANNPNGRVLIPGERGFDERNRRLLDGCPLGGDVVEKLAALGQHVGVEFPRRVG